MMGAVHTTEVAYNTLFYSHLLRQFILNYNIKVVN